MYWVFKKAQEEPEMRINLRIRPRSGDTVTKIGHVQSRHIFMTGKGFFKNKLNKYSKKIAFFPEK